MKQSFPVKTHKARSTRPAAVVVGLGPIGREVAQLVLERHEVLRLAACIDSAPEVRGAALATLLERPVAGRVRADAPPARSKSDIAFVTTTSSVASVAPTVEALLKLGYHIVSSTEELSYPDFRAASLAARLDRAARRAGRGIVGTGINPGFAMDVWPLVLSSNMQRLDAVHVHRAVDAKQRREPLQRKVGAGMTAEEFESLAAAGRIGHVGLVESAAHLAGALGWSLDRLDEQLEPVLATAPLRTAYFEVPAGRVCGIHHRVVGRQGDKERVVLDLRMALDVDTPQDEVKLVGHPSIRCLVPGGFHGDRTTASQLVAAALRLPRLGPGLHLASDLPSPRFSATPVKLTWKPRPAGSRTMSARRGR